MKAILAALAASSMLSGCFFFYVPGSLVGQVSDSLTGATGEHCVREGVKVGDRVHDSSGRQATVISLSGASVRCPNKDLPLRAAVTFD